MYCMFTESISMFCFVRAQRLPATRKTLHKIAISTKVNKMHFPLQETADQMEIKKINGGGCSLSALTCLFKDEHCTLNGVCHVN